MGRKVSKLTLVKNEAAEQLYCCACEKTVEYESAYVKAGSAVYHNSKKCIPGEFHDLFDSTDSLNIYTGDEGTEDAGMNALAAQLEPYYKGGVRLEVATMRSLISDEINKRKPTKLNLVLPNGNEEIDVDGQHEMFPVLLREFGLGNNCWLTGPAGSGKTTAAIEIGKTLGRQVFVQPPVNDPFEILGYKDAAGRYHPTQLFHWIQNPGSILVLDEIDGSNARALLAINAALSGSIAVFPGGQQFEIPENNLAVATANTWGLGGNADYVGRCPIDGATINRFPSRINWGYDNEFEFELANQNYGATREHVIESQLIREGIVKNGIKLIWSPRDTFAHVKRRLTGVSFMKSIEASALCALEDSSRKKVLAHKRDNFADRLQAAAVSAEAMQNAFDSDDEGVGAPEA